MKKSVLFSAVGILAVCGTAASAQEVGRVISSTPVVQQVAVPRQVCSSQQVAVQQPKTGAGAVMGGIAGGAMGNAIGGGSGRAAATMLGIFGGAILGDRIEGSGTQVQNVQQCGTQTSYENRTVGYSVVYEYGGKQYNVQMPNDPGPTIRLQVTPVGASNAPPNADTYAAAAAPVVTAPAMGQPVGQIVAEVAPSQVAYPAYPAPYPAYPAYYPASYSGYGYYPPIGLSLNFGYSAGYGHYGHSGHWR
jgi:uncharacterized protein YcfJ